MKNPKEIIARSVILLCISDRCSLEKSTIGGRVYPKEQREEQRIAIYQWLQSKGYTEFITGDEKLLFEQEVESGNKIEVLSNQVQYEAIEPCLWTLSLVKEISNYDHFVNNDFHPVLKIGVNHTLEQVLDSCYFRNFEDIYLQNKISMLWHWRAIESNNSIFKSIPVIDVVKSVFGEEYVKVLENIQQFKNNEHDFMVNNIPFSNLTIEQKKRINSIAYWRHYAFEWIVGDERWDEVDINT